MYDGWEAIKELKSIIEQELFKSDNNDFCQGLVWCAERIEDLGEKNNVDVDEYYNKWHKEQRECNIANGNN